METSTGPRRAKLLAVKRLADIGGPKQTLVASLDLRRATSLDEAKLLSYVAGNGDLVVNRLMLDDFDDDLARFGDQLDVVTADGDGSEPSMALRDAIDDARQLGAFLVIVQDED